MSDAGVVAEHAPAYALPMGAPRILSVDPAAGPGARCLAFLALLVFAAGALAPLGDIDLPIHLAAGEWIVRHHAVPWTEPFAWTRPGAPYLDYSWAADAAYFATWRTLGAAGLHVVAGLQLLAAAGAVVWLGRVARWRAWTVVVVAWAHVWIATAIADYLRPQTLILAVVPAAWALTLRVARDASPWRAAIALYVVAVIAANTHFFFILTALPLVTFVTELPDGVPLRRIAWQRVALCIAALVLGALTTPYALAWPEVYRLNLTGNPLLAYPSPIVELRSGFVGLSPRDRARLAGLGLALLPWAAARMRVSLRTRMIYMLLWLAGLVGFAIAVRSLFIWWLVMIPVVALVADAMMEHLTARIARLIPVAAAAFIAVLGARYALEMRSAWPPEAGPGSAARTLPSPAALLVEPSLAWLDRNARHPVRGRLLTVFSFGSYVVWRMPGLSPSVDGRGVFPDSAVAPDAYWRSTGGPMPLGPWRSADVAIVPVTFPVASVLDTARGWQRIDVESRARGAGPWAPGLWVRTAWLERTAGH